MKPIVIQNEFLTIKPILGNTTDEEMSEIMNGVSDIFSDADVIAEYPEKRLRTHGDIQKWFASTISGYQIGTSSNHFISLKSTGQVIGVIEVNTSKALEKMPSRASLFTHYPELKGCIEIEYWLDKSYWNRGIMSGVIGAFTSNALEQGIPAITAFVSANNQASKAVLVNAGFAKAGEIPNKHGVADYHYIKTRLTS